MTNAEELYTGESRALDPSLFHRSIQYHSERVDDMVTEVLSSDSLYAVLEHCDSIYIHGKKTILSQGKKSSFIKYYLPHIYDQR